jgi:hypothetical protein
MLAPHGSSRSLRVRNKESSPPLRATVGNSLRRRAAGFAHSISLQTNGIGAADRTYAPYAVLPAVLPRRGRRLSSSP